MMMPDQVVPNNQALNVNSKTNLDRNSANLQLIDTQPTPPIESDEAIPELDEYDPLFMDDLPTEVMRPGSSIAAPRLPGHIHVGGIISIMHVEVRRASDYIHIDCFQTEINFYYSVQMPRKHMVPHQGRTTAMGAGLSDAALGVNIVLLKTNSK